MSKAKSYPTILKYILVYFIAFFLESSIPVYGQSAIYSSESIHHPIIAKNGMVASQHKLATEVGLEILQKGGNAVDAAVAVGFTLAVVLPRAGNLGGGGFMVVHLKDSNTTTAINYREQAPASASRDMYLDKNGDVDNELFNASYQSIGVPGTVAGLLYALEKYGTMSLKDVIQPAIKLAQKGFPVTTDMANLLVKYEERMTRCSPTKEIFFKGKNQYYQPGDILKQKDLAWSLKQICKHGEKGFYDGELTKRIVNAVQQNGGILTLEDFKNYEVNEIDPVKGTYKGHEIISMPPPSSGGVHIIQMLNMLETFQQDSLENGSAAYYHILTEIMRLAYADRSEHLGDPAYWDVPVNGLISKSYARELSKMIADTARLSSDVKPGTPQDFESEETTHFSVVDKYGNAVANTYTLNFSFGTGLMAKGTGILLNNEMGDFSAKPGVANAYGLIGGEANAVEAGKTPLSSMTPTIVLKDGQVKLVTGSPGGSRIISTVLQTIVNVIDFDLNIAEATHSIRIHHQWYPDLLYHEKTLNPDTKRLLRKRGHKLKVRAAMGSTQSILKKKGILYGASDPRRPDAATMGF